MTRAEKQIAYQCIERIRHLWFDDTAEEEPIAKITALFQTLSVLAPYECCRHVHFLWLAYCAAREEFLPRLSRRRWYAFNAGLTQLHETAMKFPVALRQ